eukprot:1387370-Amphidinium_carterae.1
MCTDCHLGEAAENWPQGACQDSASPPIRERMLFTPGIDRQGRGILRKALVQRTTQRCHLNLKIQGSGRLTELQM